MTPGRRGRGANRRVAHRTKARLPPLLDDLLVICGPDSCGHSPAALAERSHRHGIPAIVIYPDAENVVVRWPKIGRAAVMGHGATMTDSEVTALATAMIDAGIDEVFVFGELVTGEGSQGRGPWTFKVDSAHD